jgi:transposase-like protein
MNSLPYTVPLHNISSQIGGVLSNSNNQNIYTLPLDFDKIFSKCIGVIFLFIYHDFGISVKEYEAIGKNNAFPEVDQCPHCKGRTRLYRHGFYFRNAIDANQYRIPICRLKCPSCNKTLSILPTFLLSYFQYTVDVILEKLNCSIVKGKVEGYHQLVLFYRKRFLKRLTQVEMFFRDDGFKGILPKEPKEKAIKLLEMILALGKATFVKRYRGHFSYNFMAN